MTTNSCARMLVFALCFVSTYGSSGTLPQMKELSTFYPLCCGVVPLGAFDTANGSRNAVAIANWYPTKTWRLTNMKDTSDSFTWVNGAPLAIGDFDGDSFVDYWMFKGGILRGKGNGIPPDTTVTPSSILPYEIYVVDFNNDARDDVFALSEDAIGNMVEPKTWGTISMGAKELKLMKQMNVLPPVYYQNYKTRTRVIKVFKKGVESRVVWHEANMTQNMICIGRIVVDDSSARVERLNQIAYNGGAVTTFNGWITPSVVYTNPKTGEATLLAMHATPGSDTASQGMNVFSLDKDSFEYVRSYPNLVWQAYTFESSPGVPVNNGWAARYRNPSDSLSDSLYFFSSSPRVERPCASIKWEMQTPQGDSGFPYYTRYPGSEVQAIGDVNGDGISDYAINVRGKSDYMLKIFGGVDAETLVVIEDTGSNKSFSNIYPHPISVGMPFVVVVKSDRPEICTVNLLDLNGKQIVSLYQGTIAPGTTELNVSITPMKLPASSYILRVVTGRSSYNRIIVVTN